MATKWKINYWPSTGKGDVEKWLDKLTDEQYKSVSKVMVMLESMGNMLRLPHSRSLGNGLFELRERRYEYRIYYTFHEGRVILLLAAGDKSSQKNDIKVAKLRLLEVLKYRG